MDGSVGPGVVVDGGMVAVGWTPPTPFIGDGAGLSVVVSSATTTFDRGGASIHGGATRATGTAPSTGSAPLLGLREEDWITGLSADGTVEGLLPGLCSGSSRAFLAGSSLGPVGVALFLDI